MRTGRALRPGALVVGAAAALALAGCGEEAAGPPRLVADWEGIALEEAVVEPFGAGTVIEQPGGVARDASGRTAVVATGAGEVTVFAPDGAPLLAFGARGEGRGELSGACCPAFGPDGLLWVRDGGNARYQAFEVGEEGAEVRRVLGIRHNAPTLWAPTTFDDRGRLVDPGLMVDPDTRETRPVRIHMNRETGEVEGVARLPQPPEERMGRASVVDTLEGRESTFYLYQPHGPRSLLAHGPDGRWAEAVSDTYAVRLVAPDGSVREIVGPGEAGAPLTEAERAEARETLDGYRARFGLEEEELPFGIPERKPPIRSLFFDSEGRLWVELATAGERREAHVYAPDGTPAAHRAWPADVLLDVRAWIGAEEAIGVDAGVPDTAAGAGDAGGASGSRRLVRLRFPAPGGP